MHFKGTSINLYATLFWCLLDRGPEHLINGINILCYYHSNKSLLPSIKLIYIR